MLHRVPELQVSQIFGRHGNRRSFNHDRMNKPTPFVSEPVSPFFLDPFRSSRSLRPEQENGVTLVDGLIHGRQPFIALRNTEYVLEVSHSNLLEHLGDE